MTAAQSLNLYSIAFKYFKNEADASSFVKEIEATINEKVEVKGDVFEKIVSKDIENLRQEMYRTFASKEDLSNTRAEIIKWMFIFWIGQVAVTFGFILLFIKK